MSANKHPLFDIVPDMSIPKLPFIEIQSLKIKDNGKIAVIFHVPESTTHDQSESQVRLRVVEGTDFVHQEIIEHPYHTTAKDGLTVRPKVRVTLDPEHHGRNARLEYRYRGHRTLIWFTLPGPE